jgi:hypothetical protein
VQAGSHIHSPHQGAIVLHQRKLGDLHYRPPWLHISRRRHMLLLTKSIKHTTTSASKKKKNELSLKVLNLVHRRASCPLTSETKNSLQSLPHARTHALIRKLQTLNKTPTPRIKCRSLVLASGTGIPKSPWGK